LLELPRRRQSFRDVTPRFSARSHFFTRFGSQSFFFFADTTPHSLQRKSPGFDLRIGFPFWQLTAVPHQTVGSAPYALRYRIPDRDGTMLSTERPQTRARLSEVATLVVASS